MLILSLTGNRSQCTPVWVYIIIYALFEKVNYFAFFSLCFCAIFLIEVWCSSPLNNLAKF